MSCAVYAFLVKMKEVREQGGCFHANVVARSITGIALKFGLIIEIYFTGVHGNALPAEYVRYAVEPGTQTSSCFVKDVMEHITVTVNNPRTRMLAVDLICALNIQSVTAVDPVCLGMD